MKITDRIKESINKTKHGFEESFSNGAFYNKQTQDTEHLDRIIDFLPIKDGMKIMDLGTGSGFLAFAVAKKYPRVQIIGLDIVEKALDRNREKAERENLDNLQFVNYDGILFPFEESSFDMVISRYALHHFPVIEDSMKEISRVLKKQGVLFLSDPAPNEEDNEKFIDEYMRLKKDGHIKFRSKKEWEEICAAENLELADGFDSKIRFPKKRNTAAGFDELLKKYDKSIIDSYELEITEDEIYVTEKVNNLLFCRRA